MALSIVLLPLLCLLAAPAAARQPRQLSERAPGPGGEAPALPLPNPGTRGAPGEPLVEKSDRSEGAGGGLPWLRAARAFTGDGTAFSDAVNNTGAAFACSFRTLNDRFSRDFAAINQAQWAEGKACGRCINARCVDPMCKVRDEVVTVQVVDLCPECAEGDVDFSFPAYESLTGLWPHRLQISWEWASCAADIDGTITYTPKDGITPFWQAFYLANLRFPLRSVSLNGRELQRSPYQFFIHPAQQPGPGAVLELVADNGARISAVLDDVTKAQDLAVQFPL